MRKEAAFIRSDANLQTTALFKTMKRLSDSVSENRGGQQRETQISHEGGERGNQTFLSLYLHLALGVTLSSQHRLTLMHVNAIPVNMT